MTFDRYKPLQSGPNPSTVKLMLLLLILISLHLILIQAELTRLSAGLPVASGWNSASEFFEFARTNTRIFDTSFSYYFVSLGVLLAVMLFLHFACDAVNQFLVWMFAKKTRTAVWLILLFSGLSRYYLAAGSFTFSGDSCCHLMHIWITAEAFRNGEMPTWTNWLYCGCPLTQDYGPIFYYFCGLVAAVMRNFDFAIKLSLFLIHVASGLAFFYAAADRSFDKRSALLGALAYVLIGWHAHFILVQGRCPIALLYVFMPLCYRETAANIDRKAFPWRRDFPALFRLGLFCALLFLSHFIYAFQFLLFTAVYAGIRMALDYRSSGDRAALAQTCLRFAAAFLLFLILAGGFLVPFFAERQSTMMGLNMTGGTGWGTAARTFNLMSWIVWNNPRFPLFPYGHRLWDDSYYGLIVFLFILSVFVLAFILRKTWRLSNDFKAVSVALLCVLTVIVLWPLWEHLPVLKGLYVTPCERYQLSLVFYLSAFLTFSMKELLRIGDRAFPLTVHRHLPPILTLLLILDLGSLSFQTPYGLTEEWDKHDMMTARMEKEFYTANRAMPPVRAFYEGMSWYDYEIKGAPNSVRHAYYPTFVGSYCQGSPLMYEYVREFYPIIREAFFNRPVVALTGRIRNFFFLTNTRLIILNGKRSVETPEPFERIEQLGEEKTLLFLKNDAFALFSDSLFAPPVESDVTLFLRKILDQYKIDYVNGYAEAIFVRPVSAAAGLIFPRGGKRPVARVISFSQKDKEARFEVESDGPVYIRLPFSFHPSLQVRVNGKPASPIEEALHFICLRLDSGRSVIELSGGLSPLRKRLLAVSVLTAVAGLLVCLGLRRRKEKKKCP